MNTEIGCGFCQRSKGLPVFLSRPAIMDKTDTFPILTSNVKMPVEPQGETAYTARILREGFLYVYYEKFNLWEIYTVTSKGHYYLHPGAGGAPQCLSSEKKTVCMDDESKVARASFITLYIMPEGQENGVVWFAWSDAPWSEKMKKRHEDQDQRIKNMQPFDVDLWLSSSKHENVESLNNLQNTVAEYSTGSKKIVKGLVSTITDVSHIALMPFTVPIQKLIWEKFQSKVKKEADNVINEANQLYPEKGAVLFLSDPVAILVSITNLYNYRAKHTFHSNPKYSRGLALSSMLSSLKQSVCSQYRVVCEEQDIQDEDAIIWAAGSRAGGVKIEGYDSWESKKKKRKDNIKSLDERVESYWNEKYEKYIDREKEDAFLMEYKKKLSSYFESVLSPMLTMYLNWLDSEVLRKRFLYNYDSNNAVCSLLYVQAVNDCIEGMTEKNEVMDYLVDKLKQEKVSKDNFFLRAIFKNDDSLIESINVSLNYGVNYGGLPWNKIFDSITDSISQYLELVDKVDVYIRNIFGVIFKAAKIGVNKYPMPLMIGVSINRGKAVVEVSCTGQYKNFIKAVAKECAILFDMDNRIGRDRLYERLYRQMGGLELNNAQINQNGKVYYYLMIDREEADKLRLMPELERMKKLNRVFRSYEEFRKDILDGHYKPKIDTTKAKYSDKAKRFQNYTKSEPVLGKLKDKQYFGSASSLIFQSYAILASWEAATKNVENLTKFGGNVLGAIGTLADWTDRYLAKNSNGRFAARLGLDNKVKLEKWSIHLQRGARFFAWAGFVSATWDIYHAADEYWGEKEKKDYKLVIAYGASGVSSGLLVLYAVGWLTLGGPIAIVVLTAILVASAIYIALKGQDDIEKWLLSCMWRKIPKETRSIPHMWSTEAQEKEAFLDLS
ncbi:T6SS effector BTH_I2691 family protein [Xenorhabdus bharatensis]|uniref:T6SS effector BTH_I2691 family protein n=1 Tax=Xenorhabdus bharatensis TaxID=3136256 RepID=UPI0030F3F8A0